MAQLKARNMGGAWLLAAVLWTAGAAVEVVKVPEGAAFVLFEVLWIAAHVAVMVGLVALARLYPYGDRRIGTVGLKVAIVARVVFLLGEADCLRTGTNESALLPIAAVLTTIGMLLLGSAVVRERAWHGWRRFAPLSMGVYPLLAMFPLAAATGEPPSAAIGGWALTFVAVGMACVRESSVRPLRAGSVRPPFVGGTHLRRRSSQQVPTRPGRRLRS